MLWCLSSLPRMTLAFGVTERTFAARVDLYFFLPCGRKFWFSTHTCILFILYYPAACDRPCSFFYFHYKRRTYIVVITASLYLTLGRERRPISWRWLDLEGLKGLITLCCCFWNTWQIDCCILLISLWIFHSPWSLFTVGTWDNFYFGGFSIFLILVFLSAYGVNILYIPHISSGAPPSGGVCHCFCYIADCLSFGAPTRAHTHTHTRTHARTHTHTHTHTYDAPRRPPSLTKCGTQQFVPIRM